MATTNASIAYTAGIYSISVRLVGLDPGYAYTGRTARWAILGIQYDDYATVTLPPNISSGGGTTFSGLNPSTTYHIYCTIELSDGTTYSASNTGLPVTTLPAPAPTRPDDWVWTQVGVGKNLSFPASEWNSFTARINAFRDYKDKSSYPFTTARAGMDINSSIVNEAVAAINDMSPPTRAASAVADVTDFNAAYFQALARALNSIT